MAKRCHFARSINCRLGRFSTGFITREPDRPFGKLLFVPVLLSALQSGASAVTGCDGSLSNAMSSACLKNGAFDAACCAIQGEGSCSTGYVYTHGKPRCGTSTGSDFKSTCCIANGRQFAASLASTSPVPATSRFLSCGIECHEDSGGNWDCNTTCGDGFRSGLVMVGLFTLV